jgi:F1F0 ATPase subunit 2
MTDALLMLLAWAVGMLLGVVFFGGLWWTVRKGVSARRPALWFLGSMLLRTGLVLSGVYVVSAGHWQRMLLCLLGFFMIRPLALWWTRRSTESDAVKAQRIPHAP